MQARGGPAAREPRIPRGRGRCLLDVRVPQRLRGRCQGRDRAQRQRRRRAAVHRAELDADCSRARGDAIVMALARSGAAGAGAAACSPGGSGSCARCCRAAGGRPTPRRHSLVLQLERPFVRGSTSVAAGGLNPLGSLVLAGCRTARYADTDRSSHGCAGRSTGTESCNRSGAGRGGRAHLHRRAAGRGGSRSRPNHGAQARPARRRGRRSMATPPRRFLAVAATACSRCLVAARRAASLDESAAPACRRSASRRRRSTWRSTRRGSGTAGVDLLHGGYARAHEAARCWRSLLALDRRRHRWSARAGRLADLSAATTDWRTGPPDGSSSSSGWPTCPTLRTRIDALRAQAGLLGRRPPQPAVAAGGARGAQPPAARHGLADRGHAGWHASCRSRAWPRMRRP